MDNDNINIKKLAAELKISTSKSISSGHLMGAPILIRTLKRKYWHLQGNIIFCPITMPVIYAIKRAVLLL